MDRDESLERDLKASLLSRPARSGLACLDEEKLLQFYRGGLSETECESVRDHLAECPTCVALARDTQRFLEAMGELHVAERATRTPWLLAVAASLAVGAAAALWLARGRENPPRQATPSAPSTVAQKPVNRWKDLRVARAEYRPSADDELIWRSGEQTPASGAFERAMQPYVHGDYAAAATSLERFLTQHPNYAEAHFYRGVSLLLLGNTEGAKTLLEIAVRLSSGRGRDEARWYLALACLKSDDPGRALPELDALAGSPGARRAEAERLRDEVRRVLDSESPSR